MNTFHALKEKRQQAVWLERKNTLTSRERNLHQSSGSSIPHSRSHAIDRQIWAYTPRGIFTVSSAYKVALSLSSQTNTGRASTNQAQHLFRRTIWLLHIPPQTQDLHLESVAQYTPYQSESLPPWCLGRCHL